MGDTCPKCGQTEVDGDKCQQCGVVIAAYRRYLDQLHRGPRASAHPRGTAAPAAHATISSAAVAAQPARQSAPVVDGRAVRRLTFHGDAGTLFSIQMFNSLLIILTLGVYWFWARVKARAYLLSETELEGDRFHYHGTGKELLIGGLKAAVVFGVPFVVVNLLGVLGRGSAVIELVTGVASYGIVLTFFAVAMFGARRYRLSRTSWRGIRFSFRGDVREFTKLFVGGSILAVFSFGLYVPIFFTRQYGYLTSNSWFGSGRFGFDGRTHGLFWPYVKMLALLVPTLGLYAFWYWAEQQRYFWNHTTFGGARFRSTVTGGGLLGLHLVNVLALVVTLGLAWPWAVIRKWRYRLDHLLLEGPLGLGDVVQQAQPAESIAGVIDLDVG